MIEVNEMFVTPKDSNEIMDYIDCCDASIRADLTLIMGLTWNYLVEKIEGRDIKKIGIFATPKSVDDIQSVVQSLPEGEGFNGVYVQMATQNFIASALK